MRARDPANRVLALPSQTPGLIERIGLSRADADRVAWAVDSSGRLYAAGAAINRVLVELPGWRWLALVAWLPPLFPLTQRGYYWFAAHRHHFGRFGVAPACSHPGARCTPAGE